MGIGAIRWSFPAVWDTFPRFLEKSEFLEPQRELFFARLSQLKPGLHLLVTHPGLYPPGHAGEMREIILSPKTRQIIHQRKIKLVSYADLWERKFGKGKKTLGHQGAKQDR